MVYRDGAGRNLRRLVAPSKIYVDEGVYYAAMWTDVADVAPQDLQELVHKDMTINKETGEPRIWQVLTISRIEEAQIVDPTAELHVPDVSVSDLRKWITDTATPAVFITDQPHLQFIKTLADAHVEPCGEGEKVHLFVRSDSWFVAFCIAHARHIVAVAPETLRSMMVARAQRELSISEETAQDTEESAS